MRKKMRIVTKRRTEPSDIVEVMEEDTKYPTDHTVTKPDPDQHEKDRARHYKRNHNV